MEGLGHQIASATDLQSVVRTMKALALSSIGQYERSVRALTDYYRTVELSLGVCLRTVQTPTQPTRPGSQGVKGPVRAVVFGSDQGLVGRFNEVVADHAVASLGKLSEAPRVWAVGERVYSQLADVGLPPVDRYALPTSVNAIAPLVGRILLDTQRDRRHDEELELHLYYNSPGPGATYTSVQSRLLPLDDDWRRQRAGLTWPTGNLPEVMGEQSATLAALVGEYLFVSLFRACVESLASENASRLAAMERADKNIGELLGSLGGRFHKLRQSRIDEELFDLIAGFDALRNGTV
jgi:F-type H+-transporting ATPase subunit gamma